MEQYTETELRKWYQNNVGAEFDGFEDEFILSAKRFCNAGTGALSPIISDVENPNYEDELPRAEALIGDHYIPVEQVTLDLLKGILRDITVGCIIPGAIDSRVALISSIFDLVFSVGEKVCRLSPECIPFYKYLVTTQYTYTDRIKDLFHHDKGFPMQAAIESFCQLKLEKDPYLIKTKLHGDIENVVVQLKDAGVISNVSNDRYIISF